MWLPVPLMLNELKYACPETLIMRCAERVCAGHSCLNMEVGRNVYLHGSNRT